MQWQPNLPSKRYLRKFKVLPKEHNFVLTSPFIDFYQDWPEAYFLYLQRDWPTSWKNGMEHALRKDRWAIQDIIEALPDTKGLKIHHFATACRKGKMLRQFLLLFVKAAELTNATLESLDLKIEIICGCEDQHQLSPIESMESSCGDWRSEKWRTIFDKVSATLKSLIVNNAVHVTAFSNVDRLKNLQHFQITDCSHFRDADIKYLQTKLRAFVALTKLSLSGLSAEKIQPESIISLFKDGAKWSEQIEELQLQITPEVPHFKFSLAFQYLKSITKLVLDVPFLGSDSSHSLSSLSNLTKLHTYQKNLFLPGTSREQVRKFTKGLEELHLLDREAIPFEEVATVLSFCRETLKNVSIVAPLTNLRPLQKQLAKDFHLVHLETGIGGEILWQNVPLVNFNGLQTLSYQGTGEDWPAQNHSFIQHIIDAATTLRHLQLEPIFPISSWSWAASHNQHLETQSIRLTGVDLGGFLRNVTEAHPIENHGGDLVDRLPKFPRMKTFEIKKWKQGQDTHIYRIQKNGLGQVHRFLTHTTTKRHQRLNPAEILSYNDLRRWHANM